MASTTDRTNLRSGNQQKNTLYSDSEALIVSKNFQDENTFEEALSTLTMWLEKGECTEHTADNFYSLIRKACARVNYLQQKRVDCKDKISERRSELMQHIQNSLVLLGTIKTVLNLAEEEKVKHLFTEAQRNDIKIARATIEKSEEKHMDELAICDNRTVLKDKLTSRSLAGRGINTSSDIEELQREKAKLQEEKRRTLSQLAEVQEEKNRLRAQLTASTDKCKESHKVTDCTSSANNFNFGIQRQAHLISVISPFLYVHRDSGQTLKAISYHLQYLGFHVSEQEVEDILVSNPSIFESRLCSKGTNEEKRWIFCGYER